MTPLLPHWQKRLRGCLSEDINHSHYTTPDGDGKEDTMNEDAYYDRLLREYDRDVWADLEREAEERLAAGDIACDRWRDDGC